MSNKERKTFWSQIFIRNKWTNTNSHTGEQTGENEISDFEIIITGVIGGYIIGIICFLCMGEKFTEALVSSLPLAFCFGLMSFLKVYFEYLDKKD